MTLLTQCWHIEKRHCGRGDWAGPKSAVDEFCQAHKVKCSKTVFVKSFLMVLYSIFLTFMTIMINDIGMKTSAILPFDNQSMKFDCNRNIILYIVFAEVI